MKWSYELSREEWKTTPPENIIVGVDRLNFNYITLGQIYGVWVENGTFRVAEYKQYKKRQDKI